MPDKPPPTISTSKWFGVTQISIASGAASGGVPSAYFAGKRGHGCEGVASFGQQRHENRPHMRQSITHDQFNFDPGRRGTFCQAQRVVTQDLVAARKQ